MNVTTKQTLLEAPAISPRLSLKALFVSITLLLLSMLTSPTVFAAPPSSYFGLSGGYSSLSIDDYDYALFTQLFLGVHLHDLLVEGGIENTTRYAIKSEKTNYIEIRGFDLRTYKPYALSKHFTIAPGIGVTRWDADVFLHDKKSGKDSGFSPNYSALVDYAVNDFFNIRASASYLQEVSGANITQWMLGVLVSY